MSTTLTPSAVRALAKDSITQARLKAEIGRVLAPLR